MFFLSAQPNESFFYWQLKIQHDNFLRLGIKQSQIHALSCQDVNKQICGTDLEMSLFTDNRNQKNYLPSLRPHLIKKHLSALPELYKGPFFYHDSDILFREMPRFEGMLDDEIWYLSDTRSYLDTIYIKRFGGDELLSSMCAVVGIDPQIVIANNENAGGAQYLMKNTTYEFWDKVEADTESLFNVMNRFNNEKAEEFYLNTGKKKSEFSGIQAWCADMWAVLWNAWLFGYKTKIHPEMDFCWVDDKLNEWNRKNILHYTGLKSEHSTNEFDKRAYMNYDPFYEDLNLFNKKSCSNVIVNTLLSYERNNMTQHKIDMTDAVFVLPYHNDGEYSKINLQTSIRYLYKNFKTQIIILDYSNEGSISEEGSLPPTTFSINVGMNGLDANHIPETLYCIDTINVVFVVDYNMILPLEEIINGYRNCKTYKQNVALVPEQYLIVDKLFRELFKKVLNVDILLLNKNKFNVAKNAVKKTALAIYTNANDRYSTKDLINKIDKYSILTLDVEELNIEISFLLNIEISFLLNIGL